MLEFKPAIVNGKMHSYRALENGKEIGACKFVVNNQYVEIMHIEALRDDTLILEGLIRSALNFAANRNAYIAKINPKIENTEIFTKLGFEKVDGIFENDIPSALKTSCSCFA